MKIKFQNLILGFDKTLKANDDILNKEYTESEISKAFGHTLKTLRVHKGLSLNELSKEIDIPNPTINRYENGINIPTITQALKIADYFDLSIELFVLFGIVAINENADITPLYDKLNSAIVKVKKK